MELGGRFNNKRRGKGMCFVFVISLNFFNLVSLSPSLSLCVINSQIDFALQTLTMSCLFFRVKTRGVRVGLIELGWVGLFGLN